MPLRQSAAREGSAESCVRVDCGKEGVETVFWG